MVATGELIRAMNYVDDMTATLRRICIVTSLVILSLPIVASILLHYWHCP